jgi:hypothetical protein
MDRTGLPGSKATGDLAAKLARQLISTIGPCEGGFAEHESIVLAGLNEIGRRAFEQLLETIEVGFGDEILVDGIRYRRHELGEVEYHTLCGSVAVRRHSYRQVGVHNGPIIVPLDLAAGMIERTTPALAFSIAQGFATTTSREYEKHMHAAHRSPPSRSTVERVGHRIGADMERTLPTIEAVVRADEDLPPGIATISLGLDRTAVPMEEPRDAIDGSPRRRRREPYERMPPPPVEVVYRMAYVGTVALHDQRGDVLAVRRFAATAEDGPTELIRRVFDEIDHVRRERPRAALAIIQDGAPELWNLVGEACRRRGIEPKTELIDWFHVQEHLAAALDAMCVDETVAQQLRERWCASLLRSDSTIDNISRFLSSMDFILGIGSAEERLPKRWHNIIECAIDHERQQALSAHAEYIRRHKDKMRYASARRRGHPIGSGVTEGACKSVVTMRCKRSGQRWHRAGLSACLTLRTLHLSERLRASFAQLHPTYRRDVRAA